MSPYLVRNLIDLYISRFNLPFSKGSAPGQSLPGKPLIEIENPLNKHDNFIVAGEIGGIGGVDSQYRSRLPIPICMMHDSLFTPDGEPSEETSKAIIH
jgi:hypothetical protein